MRRARPFTRIVLAIAAAAAAILLPRPASAQLGQMMSPGRLARAHASLEGAANCQKCHEAGKGVVADKCLSCHRPIADRIRLKKGVHKDVTTDCVSCHVEHAGVDAELRPFDTKAFDHAADAGFALTGRHAAVQCQSCHKTRSFLAAKPACASCHVDVHKGQLGSDCARCHAVSVAFKNTRQQFDHSRTGFPLVGAHRRIDCATCHPNGRYTRATRAGAAPMGGQSSATTCQSCHKSPHRTAVGNACATCHSSETWRTQKIDHARTGFPLKGLHARVDCASCHRQSAVKTPLKAQKCADCHSDPHKGRFKQDCATCHNERGFGGAPFDHAAQTKFPLEGSHAKLACVACHTRGPVPSPARSGAAPPRQTGPPVSKNLEFRGLKMDCASCHRDVHQGEVGTACQACHNSATFRQVKYVHKTQPEFFAGNHAGLSCAKCHGTRTPAPGPSAPAAGRSAAPPRAASAVQPARPGESDISRWKFKGVTADCASCHRDPHLGQLGASCERCHTVEAAKFAAPKFSHATTGFALTGKHEPLPCAKCHKTETGAFPSGQGTAVRFKGVGSECRACHQDTHLGQLGKKCELCHDTRAFTIPGYTHLLRKDMSEGRHVGLECRACHKREEATFPDGPGVAVRFIGLPDGCASCHADVHKGTLGSTCQTCHTVDSFKTISRAFHKGGTFPLEGQHLNVACASCHVNGQIKGTPSKCYDCHWERRQDDRYRLRLGTDCESCHRPTSWTSTRWSHVAATGVALNPTHRILGCDSCHKQLEFRKGIGVDCGTCHMPEYQRTTAPNHAAAGFPTACEACHRPSDLDWHGARFDHNATFPLVGQHALATCATCHRNNVYRGTPRECVACHEVDYRNAKQPDHAAAGFSLNCEQCHRNSDPDWHRATFNHDQFFRLDGQHRVVPCVACHGNGVYKGTPRECVACHRTDYERAQNPNHVASGFSTACETCHRSSDPDWHSASFNHDQFFRLEGTHRTLACASCHANGRFDGTPTDCVSCHRANYDRTTNPNHAAAGFPTTCESCHRASDSSWNQGRFNHTFPISGPHRVTCNRCHLDPNNYRVFSCTVCHERGVTDSHHRSVNGYRYESTACFACHPNGRH